MEEEICYSTVVIKNGKPRSQEETEETIYSEVKPEKKVSSVSEPTEAEVASCSHSHLLHVCLVVLCVLLVGSIAAVISFSLEMNKQKTNLRNLAAENQQLLLEKRNLENQMEELSRNRDDLKWMLGVILTFDSFPVKDLCPNKQCQPCQTGWMQFEKKCYLFYDETPWKSWEQSRQYCQQQSADLVVVDNLQEQEFITNHSKFYFDKFHGFWLGLKEVNDQWVWIDGRNDTLGFWMKEVLGETGPRALLIPGRNLTENWDPSNQVFQNKFICEHKVLTRSSQVYPTVFRQEEHLL